MAELISKAKNRRRMIIVGAVLLFLFITLLTSVKMVGTGQVGVVTMYGKVTGRELDEGLSLVAPWGVERVAIYDIKVQKESVRSTAASKDLQDVTSEIVSITISSAEALAIYIRKLVFSTSTGS